METIFKYKDKEYTLKKRNMQFINDTVKIKRDFQNTINEYAYDSLLMLKQYEQNTDSKEYKYWNERYNEDLKDATIDYITRENNIRNIFDKLLKEDTKHIDIDVEDNELQELYDFVNQILRSFFLLNKAQV